MEVWIPSSVDFPARWAGQLPGVLAKRSEADGQPLRDGLLLTHLVKEVHGSFLRGWLLLGLSNLYKHICLPFKVCTFPGCSLVLATRRLVIPRTAMTG